MSDVSDDEPTIDPAEARREAERAKLRELKKRKIRGTYGGLGLLPSHAPIGKARHGHEVGVYIRRDVEDESPEVDITMNDAAAEGRGAGVSLNSKTTTASPPPSRTPSRVRKPTHKAQSYPQPRGRPKQPVIEQESDEEEGGGAEADVPATKTKAPRGQPGKLKSETYKQAWSVSEQCLLEKLLEEIPDGEKNRCVVLSRPFLSGIGIHEPYIHRRWQKISRAMNGRRTPRQVASRVQKYFEKLKKFGVGL